MEGGRGEEREFVDPIQGNSQSPFLVSPFPSPAATRTEDEA